MLDAEEVFAGSKSAGKLEGEVVGDIVPVRPRAGECWGDLVDLCPLSGTIVGSSSARRLRDIGENWGRVSLMMVSIRGIDLLGPA